MYKSNGHYVHSKKTDNEQTSSSLCSNKHATSNRYIDGSYHIIYTTAVLPSIVSHNAMESLREVIIIHEALVISLIGIGYHGMTFHHVTRLYTEDFTRVCYMRIPLQCHARRQVYRMYIKEICDT